MALLQNISLHNQYPIRQTGSAYFSNFNHLGADLGVSMNKYVGEANISHKAAYPNGYRPGSAWLPQMTTGGMAIYYGISGIGDVSDANLAGGKLASCTIAGVGQISSASVCGYGLIGCLAQGSASVAAGLVGSLFAYADLAGSGDIVSDILGIARAGANCAGIGSILLPMISGLVEMSADLSGEASFSDANLAGVIWATVALLGLGAIDPTIKGIGLVEATIAVGTPQALTAEEVAAAVWNENRTSHITADSFGEFVQKLLTTAKFLGLK